MQVLLGTRGGGLLANESVQASIEVLDDAGRPLVPAPAEASVTLEVRSQADAQLQAPAASVRRDLDGGQADGGTGSTLTDADKTWRPGEWRDAVLLLTGGAGAGQQRRVLRNTATALTVDVDAAVAGAVVGPLAPVPDATTTYALHRGGFDASYAVPAAALDEYLVLVARATIGGVTETQRRVVRVEGAAT